MMGAEGTAPPSFHPAPGRFVLAALPVLLAVFPPETRGESLAGCALLVALLAVLAGRLRAGDARAAALAAAGALCLVLASSSPAAAVAPVATAALGVASGIAVSSLPLPVRRGPLLSAGVSTAASLAAIHALFQRLAGLGWMAAAAEADPLLPDRALVLERLREGRAFAAFATPAALGALLAIALPVTAGWALSRRGLPRYLLLALVALQAGGLYASASATAVGALLGAVTLAFVARRRTARRALALSAGLLAVLLVAVAVARGGRILDLRGSESPWRLRAGNFRAAAAMVREHPWTGVGPGAFGEALPRYIEAGDNKTRYAHDLPLQLAAETGIPAGVCLTVLFFGLFAAPALRSGRNGPTGARIGLLAFALQNLGDFTAFLPSVLWTACLLRGAEAGDGDDARAPGKRAALPLGVAVLAGVVVAAALSAAHGLAWDARIRAREALARGDSAAAEALSRRSIGLAPWDVDAALMRAQVLLAVRGQSPEGRLLALREADRAVGLAQGRPAARDLRGRIRLDLGDAPGAYADWREASRLYPLKAEYGRRRDEMETALERTLPRSVPR